MEFRDALKSFRSELGLAQVDIANALHINIATVGRWEQGKTIPSRSFAVALLDYAKSKSASDVCLANLSGTLDDASKQRLLQQQNSLFTVEHASVSQLIDDAAFPIYVCDMETDELLYLNQNALAMVGTEEPAIGRYCYECLMHRDTPCDFCHKNELSEGNFKSYDAFRPFDGVTYHVQGKLIQWNGRRAQVRYVLGQGLAPVKLLGSADTAEDAIKPNSEEQKQNNLLDNLPCGAALYEFDGKTLSVIHINKSYWQLVERDPVDYTHESVLEVIHPEDKSAISQELNAAIQQNRSINVSIRILCGKSGYKPFNIKANVTPEENGKYLLFATYTPISDEEMSLQEMLTIALSTMMSSSEDFSFVKDKTLRYVCCSRSSAKAMGLSDDKEVIGKTDTEAFGEKYAEIFAAQDREIMRTGQPLINHIESVILKDGSMIVVNACKYPIMDSAGNVIGIYGVSHDVTAQKEMESQLEFLTKNIPGGLATYFCTSDSIRLDYCNKGFCDLFGMTQEEYVATAYETPLLYVFEEDREALRAKYAEMMKTGTAIDCVYRIHVKDGTFKWIHLRATIADNNGNGVYMNTLLFDITQDQEERELHKIREQEYRLATLHNKRTICRYDIANRTITFTSEGDSREFLPDSISDVPYGSVKNGQISEDTAQNYTAFYEDIINGKKECTAKFMKLINTWRWIEARSTTIFDNSGNPVTAVISYVDITEEQEKEAVNKKYQQMLVDRGSNTYLLFRCNLNKDSSYDTKEGALFEFTPSGDENSTFIDRAREFARQCVIAEDRDRYLDFVNSDTMLASYYRGKRSDIIEFRGILPNGDIHWIRLSIELIEYPDSTDIAAYFTYEDINESKSEELEVIVRTETDPLTGIFNRKAFEAKVNESIRSSKADTTHALLMLDIDGFKLVNDVFGHGAGDQTLIDVAAQLQKVIRRDDYAGRLGGDEFVVFLTDIPNEKIAAMKAQQICELVKKNFSVEVQISGSVGIALYPKDGNDFESLYKKADTTLYYVKDSGKNNFAFYHDDMTDSGEIEAREPISGVALKKLNIKRRMLIADDNRVNCEFLSNMFKDDFRVDVVYDGTTALTKIHHYDAALSIILLDLMMPGMDGYTVLEKMQRDAGTKGIPVVVITGSDDRETILKVISSGAADMVTKPIDLDILRIRVNSVINKVENERLRAQNSVLSMLNDEISSYQTALEQLGMAVIVNYWIHGNYLYSPSVSKMLKGNYDDRKLWMILLSDMVADTTTVQKMQQLVHDIADDRERDNGQIVVKLLAKSGQKRDFEMNVFKQVNEFGLAERMIIALREVH